MGGSTPCSPGLQKIMCSTPDRLSAVYQSAACDVFTLKSARPWLTRTAACTRSTLRSRFRAAQKLL